MSYQHAGGVLISTCVLKVQVQESWKQLEIGLSILYFQYKHNTRPAAELPSCVNENAGGWTQRCSYITMQGKVKDQFPKGVQLDNATVHSRASGAYPPQGNFEIQIHT